jgi:hypothetical protein
MIDNNQKPLFEYSDLELKSIGFDMLELIENYKNNITLIRIEMSRRKTSAVLSTVNQNDLPKIFRPNNMSEPESVSFDNKEYSESYNPTTTKVSSQPQSNFKNLTDDTNSLITPLRKQ